MRSLKKFNAADGTGQKDISVRSVPVDLWRKVHVRAAQEGITIRQLVIRAVALFVEGEGDKNGN